MRKTIYTNMLKNNIKYLLWYNALRVCPVLLLIAGVMVAYNASFSNIIYFVLALILFVYRLKVFEALHEIMNVLEFEVDAKQINLVTTSLDYPVKIEAIQAIGLRVDPMNKNNLDMFFQIHGIGQEEKMVEWPAGLIEQGYIRVPMIFEDHTLTMLEDHPFLKEICRNYEKMKSDFARKQAQMQSEKTQATRTVNIDEL